MTHEQPTSLEFDLVGSNSRNSIFASGNSDLAEADLKPPSSEDCDQTDDRPQAFNFSTPVLVLEPGRADRQYWLDLWRYRELFYILAWRDISVRYKQTVIGVAWALLQPLLTMIVMTVIFGKVAKLPSEGDAPYALMVFAAMLPWTFFSSSLSSASQSLVGNAQLISKVYFPRMIIPAAAVITSFVDFLVSFLILAGMMLWYGFMPDWRILTLPLFIALAFLAAIGPGLWITALNVKYRDFRYIIPFIVQFGLYASPVAYSSTVIRDRFGPTVFAIYSLNPVVGVIDGFRWAVLGGQSQIYWPGFLLSLLTVAAFLVIGVRYFRKTEKTFADVI
jgi:lipopolysaccharide transport system permease protein